MTDSLKERLRGDPDGNEAAHLLDEALARIEELEAESQENWQKYVDANEALIDAQATIAKLEEEVLCLTKELKGEGILRARLATLQGKLDRALEGLEEIAGHYMLSTHRIARAVLSDITSESKE